MILALDRQRITERRDVGERERKALDRHNTKSPSILIDCIINLDCHNNKDEKDHVASIKEQTLRKDQAKKRVSQIPIPRSPHTPNQQLKSPCHQQLSIYPLCVQSLASDVYVPKSHRARLRSWNAGGRSK